MKVGLRSSGSFAESSYFRHSYPRKLITFRGKLRGNKLYNFFVMKIWPKNMHFLCRGRCIGSSFFHCNYFPLPVKHGKLVIIKKFVKVFHQYFSRLIRKFYKTRGHLRITKGNSTHTQKLQTKGLGRLCGIGHTCPLQSWLLAVF